MEKITFKIQEMDCAEECNLLTKALKGKKGIENLQFDVLSQKMEIAYDPTLIDSRSIQKMIRSTGMHPTIWREGGFEETLSFWKRHGKAILCFLSGVFLVIGFILQLVGPSGFGDIAGFDPAFEQLPLPVLICYLASIIAGGWFVLPKAFASAKKLLLDINLLMVIAVVGAISIGQAFEGAAVTFLFSLALLLESWSSERARRAINSLLDLSPKLARVMVNEQLIEKRVEEIQVGERILVRPGEKIPLDGQVAKGSSSVNQAPITGESMPISKEEGDQVFAGTLNEEGALEIQVMKLASDSTLARIIKMVQEARSRRAKSEKWVDRFARIYTPVMLILALCMSLIPPGIFGEPWLTWIYRGLVLLVIACPCALVISTPVSVVSGLTRAARDGVLIKGGVYLEAIGSLDALAFDKTGTITKGHPQVQKIIPLNQHTAKDLLEIATQLELPSEHPLARAILELAERESISVKPAEDFQIFKGLGAEGTIEGQRFWIGSHRFMHETKRKESEEAHSHALALEDAGHSVVAIGDFTHICGLLSVADEPRPYISETLTALRELGIKKLVMLTGDNQKTAASLAQAVGLESFYAELLPEDKVELIETIKKEYPVTAMIGDGVNDAPAMAASSFGIAMGAMGTDAAFETADIVLMTDDLSQIPWLIRHARRTLGIIKQNIFFSLSVKGVFIILAFFGLATLWMAIAADTGATLLVIFNGLRLLRKKS